MPGLRKLRKFFPLALIVLVFLTRTPLVTGSYFQADGDEAIVGLMAKDIADHNHYNIYFWGQQYGFVTFETLCSAISFKLFGINANSLKLTMLLIWAAGCIFFFFAVRNLFGFAPAAVVSLIFIFLPSWGLWAMKARGGYMTAFFFSCLSCWLMSILHTQKIKWQAAFWLALGISLVVIYFAQKLWIFSLIPFIAVFLYRHRSLPGLFALFAGGAATWFMIRMLSANEHGSSWMDIKPLEFHFVPNMLKVPGWLMQHFTGSYYLANYFDPAPVLSFTGWLWFAILLILILLQCYRMIFKKYFIFSHLCFISVCIACGVMLLAEDGNLHYRYVLPLDLILVAWLVIEFFNLFGERSKSWVARMVLILFMGLNFIGLYQLRFTPIMPYEEKETESFAVAMNRMLSFLQQNNIHHTFTGSNLLQWQIDFYSNGDICSRSFDSKDRNSFYIGQVTDEFKAGKPAALVNYYYHSAIDPEDPLRKGHLGPEIIFGKQFRVYLHPDLFFVKKAGFDLRIDEK
jgi:hypothetical protein